MDMNVAIQTAAVGFGLVGCGYILGAAYGARRASNEILTELFRSKLLTPEQVLTHYSNEGIERAQDLLAAINKAKRGKKEDNDA